MIDHRCEADSHEARPINRRDIGPKAADGLLICKRHFVDALQKQWNFRMLTARYFADHVDVALLSDLPISPFADHAC